MSPADDSSIKAEIDSIAEHIDAIFKKIDAASPASPQAAEGDDPAERQNSVDQE